MIRFVVVLFVYTLLNLHAELLTRQKVLMGTFVSLSVDETHRELLKPSFTLLKSIDASISSFDKNSFIYRLNQNKSTRLDSYAYEALKLSLEYYNDTDGYFDIAIGKITKDLYRFGANERIVSQNELKNSSTSIYGLLFDKKQASN
jgi:thiamine biosynthesis lipoprotein